MKKKCKKRYFMIFTLWLLGFVYIGMTDGGFFPIEKNYAEGKTTSEIQEEINKKNKEKQSAVEEKRQLENDIADIEKKKGDVLEYIQALDKKSNELAEKIKSNQSSIAELKQDIKQLRKEKKKATAKKENQYETMKKRIRYIYENGNVGYLELILGADSLSEFFNRTEYVSKVSNYDKNLFKNYEKTCQTIEKAERQITKKLTGLREARESLKVEKSSVADLVEKKRTEVAEYQNLLEDKNNSLGDTEVLLASQENELERLFEAERLASAKEEAEKKTEEKPKVSQKPQTKATQKPAATAVPTAAPAQPAGGYRWPLTVAGRISSPFGPRSAPAEGASTFHKGVDIAVPIGTAVLATKAGTVITATYSASAGNYIAISHGGGVYSYYMHCSSLSVSVGQSVSAGQQIALSGNSGISTGPHLHFALFMGGSYVNPLSYV